ncbi:metallophosphoesterase [Leucobacter allii]|uniref:Metallophosphoesterase n=1 Tax=Leucobacter allii TaxID=2932247 RepID=A0ABY4FIW1_9MICO|nr:metallophosphoesterase [Leucobacter allii]UOQ56631.1 metallophosphoesterase [Leucobacter allii]
MKIIQITDTHISHLGGTTNVNAERAIRFINALEPDFVIHTGDVTIMDPDEDRDRATAQEILAGIAAPWRALPGNHDVGEPGDSPFADRAVTSERVAAYRAHFGDDRFVERVGEWAVVGFNSELFGSGLPEEAEQWAWLEGLPELVGPHPVLVFTHKPVRAPSPELQNPHVAVGAESLPRLEELLARLDVRGYGSGHLHHYALTARDGAPVVSAPATAFTAGSSAGDEVTGPGLKQLGVVEYGIADGVVTPRFRAPADLVEADLLEIASVREALAAMGFDLAQIGVEA